MIQQNTVSGVSAAAERRTDMGAMAMVTTLFFMWGFLTCLNDILVPHLKAIFDLSYFQVMLVQFAFFSSYFVFGVPAGKVVEWIGYQKTMVLGLIIMAAGAFLFIPAANVPSYPLFLGALVVLAAGVTALQVAANPYVSVLGPERSASSRLNLTQAFNSLGTTIAPKLGGALILSGAVLTPVAVRALAPAALQSYRQAQASSVKTPYLLIGLVLIALAAAIAFYKLPKLESSGDASAQDPELLRKAGSIWQYRQLIFGIAAIFLYVGAEVSIGSFLVNYFSQPNTGGMTELAATTFVSFYWGGAMVGRFIGSYVLTKVKTGILLGICAICACLLVLASMLSFGSVAVWTIILVGFFNSIMFPSIFTLGIAGLGPLTGEGSGLLIAAIVGGALIPPAEGALADSIGVHHAFIIPAICYLYIMFYGFRGSRPTAVAAV